jgi:hypothetical protein
MDNATSPTAARDLPEQHSEHSEHREHRDRHPPLRVGHPSRRASRAFAMTSTWWRRKYQRPWCRTAGRNPRSTSCRTRFAVTPRISAARGPVPVVPVGVPLERDPLDVGPVEADLPVRDRLAEDATAEETGDAELVDAEDLGGLCGADADPVLPSAMRTRVGRVRRARARPVLALWKPPA